MQVKMNTQMKQLLEDTGMINYLNQVSLDPQLQAWADSKIVEVNGCFFFAGEISPEFDFEKTLLRYKYRTALEHSMSEVDIPGLFGPETNWTGKEVFAQGYKFAMRLAKHLQEIGHFHVVFSFVHEESTEVPVVLGENHDQYSYDGSQINFYLVRPDELLLSDDIEGYQEEALLVIDTLGG